MLSPTTLLLVIPHEGFRGKPLADLRHTTIRQWLAYARTHRAAVQHEGKLTVQLLPLQVVCRHILYQQSTMLSLIKGQEASLMAEENTRLLFARLAIFFSASASLSSISSTSASVIMVRTSSGVEPYGILTCPCSFLTIFQTFATLLTTGSTK